MSWSPWIWMYLNEQIPIWYAWGVLKINIFQGIY